MGIKVGISPLGMYSEYYWSIFLPSVFKEISFTVSTINPGKAVPEDVDYFILDGGCDVSPHFYNEMTHLYTHSNVERDEVERNLVLQFIPQKTKFIGICRGQQLLNVLFGGSLIQHLPDLKIYQSYHHLVTCQAGSKLEEVIPERKFPVNSIHHQAIKLLGKNLKITLLDENGIIEGIESENDDKIRAVQCHPEMLDSFKFALPLLQYLFRV